MFACLAYARRPPRATWCAWLQEGLRFLVPHMTKRVLHVSVDAMRFALARDVGVTLPRTTDNAEFTEKLSTIDIGPLALVCPCPADLAASMDAEVAKEDGDAPTGVGITRYGKL